MDGLPDIPYLDCQTYTDSLGEGTYPPMDMVHIHTTPYIWELSKSAGLPGGIWYTYAHLAPYIYHTYHTIHIGSPQNPLDSLTRGDDLSK